MGSGLAKPPRGKNAKPANAGWSARSLARAITRLVPPDGPVSPDSERAVTRRQAAGGEKERGKEEKKRGRKGRKRKGKKKGRAAIGNEAEDERGAK